MITMEMLGKVRRMYLRDKLSLREITKRTGLSRNMIREWLRKPEEVQAARPRYSRKDAALAPSVMMSWPLKLNVSGRPTCMSTARRQGLASDEARRHRGIPLHR